MRPGSKFGEMVDVLFLSPPRRADGSNYLFNNATLSLASYLHRHGLDVRVEPLVGPTWPEQLEKAVLKYEPRWVAVSCKWWDTLFGATEVARRVKLVKPDCKVVVGGQTATSYASEIVRNTCIDAVIMGDGEVPLLELVQGKPSCNLARMGETEVEILPHRYVQPRNGTEDLTLVPDLGSIAEARLLEHAGLTEPFIWTGKGCQSGCMFCAGSAYGHKKLFGRTGYLYRPIEQTLQDMEIMGQWTSGAFMFDFDPVTDPGRESYYLELCRQLPKHRYHAAFYCWSLPSHDFIQMISETFLTALVTVDAQTYSEPLRRSLSSKNQLKPFSSDVDILKTLDFCRTRPNVQSAIYGILGLSTETEMDVMRGESFMNYLMDSYYDVLQPGGGVHVTPLSLEPDALMDRNPEKYGMVKLRHGFPDFLEFTGHCFNNNRGDIFQAPYQEGRLHPYGVHLEGDGPDRVYRDFHRILTRVREKSHKYQAKKAIDNLYVGAEKVFLNLTTRSVFQDDWRLILWAAEEALKQGRKELVVDARQAFLRAPSQDLLPFDHQFGWVEPLLEKLEPAVTQGDLTINVESPPQHAWGFLQPLVNQRM